MRKRTTEDLSRRERQIMDTLYKQGGLTAMEVLKGLPDPPSYSAVRALLRILEEKGMVQHAKQGVRYIYTPTDPLDKVRQSALQRVLHTFFEGSVEKVVTALLNNKDTNLSEEEYERMLEMIAQARKDGR
jgi:predicted transcriptional regulator